MAIVEMFFWWYAHGWSVFVKKIGGWMSSLTDFFSMDSLVRTLFKPFRQISAEAAGDNASVDTKFQMFVDRLISRFVGFFSRLIILLVGLVLIITGAVISVIMILLWPIIPLLPVIGIVLTVMGVSI